MIQKVYQLKIRGFDCENSYFHFTTENKITSRLSIVVQYLKQSTSSKQPYKRCLTLANMISLIFKLYISGNISLITP